jgi:hypothetical protein
MSSPAAVGSVYHSDSDNDLAAVEMWQTEFCCCVAAAVDVVDDDEWFYMLS